MENDKFAFKLHRMADTMMDIVFTISDSYSQHCCVAMASILYNNPSTKFRFHILTDFVCERNKSLLRSLHGDWNEYSVEFYDIEPGDFDSFDLTLPHTSQHTYYRYLIPERLADLDKCLYLDSDIVVNGRLDNLWNTKLGDNYCAGIVDIGLLPEHKKILGTDEFPYVNAGVLLYNLKKIREDSMVAQLFLNTPIITEKSHLQDQDVINYTFRGKILTLPPIWNYTKPDSILFPELRSEAVIIHYTENRKPWQHDTYSRHTMRRLYFRYLRMTPFSAFERKFILKRIQNRVSNTICSTLRIGKYRKKPKHQ